MKLLVGNLKKITASKCLAVLFLCFCFWVGNHTFIPFLENSISVIKKEGSLSDYIETIDNQYSGMLSTKTENIGLHNKGTYINLNGLMSKLLGQPMMNDRLRLSNGNLAGLGHGYNPDKITAIADNISKFCLRQQNNGGNFLFVLAPSQMCVDDELIPIGYTDNTKKNADLLAELLVANNVPLLDLRQKMSDQNISMGDAFFTTDHHWKPQTAFWAYTEMIRQLDSMGAISSINTFYLDPDNFDFQIYQNSYLGSSGKRTGRYFAGTDDFCLIVPKFENNISVTINSKNVQKTGPYENIALNNTWADMVYRLENPDYFNDDPYGRYGYGNADFTNWRNPDAPEQKRFLLIGDSMGNIPFSLLPLYISSCDELDMRQYQDNFQEYYNAYEPDTVILFVNASGLLSSDADNVTFEYAAD